MPRNDGNTTKKHHAKHGAHRMKRLGRAVRSRRRLTRSVVETHIQ